MAFQMSDSSRSGASTARAAWRSASGSLRRFHPERPMSRQRLMVTRNSHAFKCSSSLNAVRSLSRRTNTSWNTSSASEASRSWLSASRSTVSPQRCMASSRNASGRRPSASAESWLQGICSGMGFTSSTITRTKRRDCSRWGKSCRRTLRGQTPIVQMRSRPPGGSGGTLGENNRRPSAEGALSNALRFLLVHASFPAVTARADCGTMGREILLFACEV